MRNRRLLKRMSVITAAVALAGITAMQSASAAEQRYSYDGVNASIDNHPGDGAPGWIWAQGSWNAPSSRVTVEWADGSGGRVIWLGRGEQVAMDLPASVGGIQLCTFWGEFDYSCQDW